MALIWKKGYFWPTFHIFLVTREKFGFSLVRFLVLILIRAILEQSIDSKMVSKI